MERMKLLKQVREEGYGLGILCPDVKAAAWAVEIIVETLTGDTREGRVTGLMVRHGRRGNIQPYLYVQDVDEGLLVAEHGLSWTARIQDMLQWLSVGALDEEILPPEWVTEDDRVSVLDRDYEEDVTEDLGLDTMECHSFVDGFESLDRLAEELEEENGIITW